MGEARIRMQEVQTELTVLRMFYDAWETLQSLPVEQIEQKKQAAEHLVEMAHSMRRLRNGDPPRIVTLNG